MNHGFEVRRDDGKVAISSVFPHYRLVKVVRGVNNFWDNTGQKYSKNVIVAFRPVNATTAPQTYRFSIGAVILWYFMGNQPKPPPTATLSFYSNVLADAYVYDTAPAMDTETHGHGIQVFNEAGQVTFDSAGRYMIIADVLQGESNYSRNPWNNQYPAPLKFTFPSHMKLAVVPLKEGFHIDFGASSDEQLYGLTWFAVYGNSVDVHMVYYLEDYYGSQTGSRKHLWYNCLVIDVSNTELA